MGRGCRDRQKELVRGLPLRQRAEMGVFDPGVWGKAKTFSGHVELDSK